MARVLIPSNEEFFLTGYILGYRANGHDVIVGTRNLDIKSTSVDIVHFLWPEELTKWTPPSKNELRQLEDTLSWWSPRAKCIASFQNLYPHGFPDNGAYDELYRILYHHCQGIHHFSEASRSAAEERYSLLRRKASIVTNGFNYSWLVREGIDRDDERKQMGLRDDEFVILIMGALRNWNEMCLIREAFARARVRGKRLLSIVRVYQVVTGGIYGRIKRKLWRRWLRAQDRSWTGGAVSDAELARYLETADAVFVPRIDSLSSGVPCLGVTFGKIVIAPRVAGIAEYLANSDNFLYDPGNVESAARAIELASVSDAKRIRESNLILAKQWNWTDIIARCLELADSSRAPQVDLAAV